MPGKPHETSFPEETFTVKATVKIDWLAMDGTKQKWTVTY